MTHQRTSWWYPMAFCAVLAGRAVVSAEEAPPDADFHVGYTVLDLPAGEGGEDQPLTVAVWYPTAASPQPHVYAGSTGGEVAVDAAPLAEKGPYPFLVFSHGFGGTGLGALFFTEALARRGWVVAAPDHNDRYSLVRIRTGEASQEAVDRGEFMRHAEEIAASGPEDRAAWLYRQEELHRVLEGLMASERFGKLIDRERIAVGGHSLGGFSALGLCGPLPEHHDPRIKAVLLFSTGAGGYLFREEELSAVRVPSMLFLGEREREQKRGKADMADLSEKILRKLPEPKYFLEVKGAGHFSFNNRFSDSATARLLSGTPAQFDVIRRYSIAFLERHVVGRTEGTEVLDETDPMLTSYRGGPNPAPQEDGKEWKPGASDRTMEHGGVQRGYRLYLPKSFDASRPKPLVIALHGGGGTGKGMEKLSAETFNRLADRDGFVVVYPDGVERHWNDGRKKVSYRAHEEIDDVGFLCAMIDRFVADLGVDPGRVYATGASNGAMMCYRLAIEVPDRFAAIAPVMCPLQAEYAAAVPPEKTPVIIIQGIDDPLAPYQGGPINYFDLKPLGEVLSYEETVAFWVRHNGASPEGAVTDVPDADPQDGTRARREAHAAKEGGAEVLAYAIQGGGHTWPGGWQYLGERTIGKTSRDFDAGVVIWEFLQAHSRPRK